MRPSRSARRRVLEAIGVTLGVGVISGRVLAAIEPGKQYQLVKTQQAAGVAGKIEVTEFFAYTCPHCFHLEPTIAAWTKKLPDGVIFQRMPIALTASSLPLVRTFFTLQAMGMLDQMHMRVFEAVHDKKIPLVQEKVLFDWITSQGIDSNLFSETYKSFGTEAHVRRGRALADAFGINSVPTLVVNGKYQTSVSMTGSAEALPKVLDELVQLARQETRKAP